MESSGRRGPARRLHETPDGSHSQIDESAASLEEYAQHEIDVARGK
jgi:hypothetical protein